MEDPPGRRGARRKGAARRLASGLFGAVWQAGESLALDVAVGAGRGSSASFYEARAGLTYAFALWSEG